MPPSDASALPDSTIEILAALVFAAVLAAAIALIAGGLIRRLLASVESADGLSVSVRKAPIRFVRLITFVVSPEGAARLHHLFRSGTEILVLP